jgi:nucleoside recognition membrane protein YjiH
MTEDQVTLLGITGIMAVAWALERIMSKYITGIFKNKRKEISLKESLARKEAEIKMYECLESVTRRAIEDTHIR